MSKKLSMKEYGELDDGTKKFCGLVFTLHREANAGKIKFTDDMVPDPSSFLSDDVILYMMESRVLTLLVKTHYGLSSITGLK